MITGRSFECRGPKAPATEDDIMSMRRRAWRQQGILVIRPEDVDAWDERQMLVNLANRIYGPRKPQ